VIKTYFERKPSLTYIFSGPDGKVLSLKAEQMNKTQIAQTISLAKAFFEDKNG
jgi:hypothetical protein